ncbi:hypothetical protein AAFF_G00369140 [Aldrovandia affinis]|uniref:Uncharacterized protein n=1 Tax=Aldrovandia affinis TaxID=143900 RepID=A0AAD7SH31_9TELE|nr:hypothetical protein AAFF_G00369140 [Aldrovandia affinis]
MPRGPGRLVRYGDRASGDLYVDGCDDLWGCVCSGRAVCRSPLERHLHGPGGVLLQCSQVYMRMQVVLPSVAHLSSCRACSMFAWHTVLIRWLRNMLCVFSLLTNAQHIRQQQKS